MERNLVDLRDLESIRNSLNSVTFFTFRRERYPCRSKTDAHSNETLIMPRG